MTKARTLADNFAADINAITAGTGITGGGTSGTVTVTNEMATTITAKGDLLAGTGNAAFDNLAAGASGETLVADSSTATGLRYKEDYAAGKNAILNGAFNIWQRGTTLNLVSGNTNFLADRFAMRGDAASGTPVFSQQTFTPGAAPVAGYEGTFFGRYTTGGNVTMSIFQAIEDVRTFAGQTVTVSFYMKTSTAKTFTILLRQNFGGGGSANVDLTASYTTTTSFARYTHTFNLASLTGKTIGTNSNLAFFPINFGAQTGNFDVDIWGVQVEASPVATAFQTATGTLAGELAACQRYYYRVTTTAANKPVSTGFEQSSTVANVGTTYPVTMRVIPTALEQSGTAAHYRTFGAAGVIACSAVPTFNFASTFMGVSTFTVASGLTAGRCVFGDLASTDGFLGWSAEL